jgi:hypothetical protein
MSSSGLEVPPSFSSTAIERHLLLEVPEIDRKGDDGARRPVFGAREDVAQAGPRLGAGIDQVIVTPALTFRGIVDRAA